MDLKLIPLTQDKYALVDEDMISVLKEYNWHANYNLRSKNFYARSKRKGKTILMHRVITNAPDGMVVDHINHDTLDNRIENLRVCTHTENKWNRRVTGKSYMGYKGVFPAAGKFRARINLNGKNTDLGYYENIKDAALAYNKAAKELFGEFANLNKI